jgi:hypothetical protein
MCSVSSSYKSPASGKSGAPTIGSSVAPEVACGDGPPDPRGSAHGSGQG